MLGGLVLTLVVKAMPLSVECVKLRCRVSKYGLPNWYRVCWRRRRLLPTGYRGLPAGYQGVTSWLPGCYQLLTECCQVVLGLNQPVSRYCQLVPGGYQLVSVSYRVLPAVTSGVLVRCLVVVRIR